MRIAFGEVQRVADRRDEDRGAEHPSAGARRRVLQVASGRSQRHVGAVADHLIRKLKDEGFGRARVEGLPHCDWVLIDAGDVIVHIFRPEVREFYNLEKMWSADRPMERMVV